MAPAVNDERRPMLSRLLVHTIEQTVELTYLAASTLGDEDTTNTAVRVLLAVHADPGVTPSALASELGLSRSAVSRALRGLQARDLVDRTPHRRDRRRRRIAVTAAGARRVASFERQLAAHFDSTSTTALAICAGSGLLTTRPTDHGVTPLRALDALAAAGSGAAADTAAAAARFGITSAAGRFAISLIAEHDGLRPVQLGSMLRLTSGGVSQLIDRLEADHLVTRELSDGGDRRAVAVALTGRGSRAAVAILDSFDPHATAICCALAHTAAAFQVSDTA